MDKFAWVHPEWGLAVGMGAFLLVVIFIWKELKSRHTPYLWLRLLAAVLAVASLAMLMLGPQLKHDSPEGVGILLTPNYKESQSDSLSKAYPSAKIWTYRENVPLQTSLDSITRLFVLGDGLAPYDFWQLEPTQAAYLEGIAPQGVTRLNYQQQQQLGDTLSLQGIYSGAGKTRQLILTDPGGNQVDSLTITGENNQGFALTHVLPVTGNFVYQLVEKDSLGNALLQNPLPVTVTEKEPLQILILNTFPTFETKYLKNFLASEGHGLLVRSQLTTNTYKFENFNREQETIYSLTRENLAIYDLVITDLASYKGLARSSRVRLNEAIFQEGLGLLVQASEGLFTGGADFMGLSWVSANRRSISLSQWPQVSLTLFPYTFSKETKINSMLTSSGEVLAGYRHQGFGKRGTTLFTNTYSLVLKGEEALYQYIWTSVMDQLAKRKQPIVQWTSCSQHVSVDEPFSFELRTQIEVPQLKSNQTTTVAIAQDAYIADRWKGTVYPKEPGWNTLAVLQDSTQQYAYYVLDSTDWQAAKTHTRTETNRHFFAKRSLAVSSEQQWVPLSKLWFYLLFLISMGYLWLAPKLYAS